MISIITDEINSITEGIKKNGEEIEKHVRNVFVCLVSQMNNKNMHHQATCTQHTADPPETSHRSALRLYNIDSLGNHVKPNAPILAGDIWTPITHTNTEYNEIYHEGS